MCSKRESEGKREEAHRNDSRFEFENAHSTCGIGSESNILLPYLNAHNNGHRRVDYNLYDRFRFISLFSV